MTEYTLTSSKWEGFISLKYHDSGFVSSAEYPEVMDREFSFVAVLLWGMIGGFLVFLAARFKPLLLFILAPVIGLFFFGHLSELIDPYVGPAMAT